MDTLKDSIISPMLDSARQITDTSHVKPQPTELATDKELDEWTQRAALTGYIGPVDLQRLIATVRALQQDLREVRTRLVESQQLIKEVE